MHQSQCYQKAKILTTGLTFCDQGQYETYPSVAKLTKVIYVITRTLLSTTFLSNIPTLHSHLTKIWERLSQVSSNTENVCPLTPPWFLACLPGHFERRIAHWKSCYNLSSVCADQSQCGNAIGKALVEKIVIFWKSRQTLC